MSKLIDKLTEITQTFPLRSKPIYLTPDQFEEVGLRRNAADPFDPNDPWGCFGGQVGNALSIPVIVVDDPEQSTPHLEGWEL